MEATFSKSQLNIVTARFFDVLFENTTDAGTSPASGRFHVSVVELQGHLKFNLCFEETLETGTNRT